MFLGGIASGVPNRLANDSWAHPHRENKTPTALVQFCSSMLYFGCKLRAPMSHSMAPHGNT